jgi:ATP-dependent Clp protease adaptor protein ClpS
MRPKIQVMTYPAITSENEQPQPPAPEHPTSESGSSRSATATKPAPGRPRLDQLPPFKVLLHNDDVNSGDFVVHSLVELTPLNKGRAVEVMLEADSTGVALVLVTHKERAELYQEQFTSKKLTVTIEPAE